MTHLKRLSPLAGAAAVALLLGACASYGDHPRHDGYAERHSAGVDYDGYYDDFYGPITDGYWAADGVFLFSTDQGRSYRRDDAHHVQRDASAGRHNIHGHHDDSHDRDGGRDH